MVNTEFKLIIVLAAEDGKALYNQQNQDLKLTVAQIISSLLQNSGLNCRSRKTTGPFMYILNQIPYDHTVEVMNRFKGLNLIEHLKNNGWWFVTLYRRQ